MQELTYATDTGAETGIVWSPGPLPSTVWVLPYTGASSSEAIVVHAPTSTRPHWYWVEDYTPPVFTAPWRMRDAETEARWCAAREAEHYRAAHHAPRLPAKLWRAAVGL